MWLVLSSCSVNHREQSVWQELGVFVFLVNKISALKIALMQAAIICPKVKIVPRGWLTVYKNTMPKGL